MFEISFLMAELGFMLIWLVARIVVWIRQGKVIRKREAQLLLMLVNLAVIIRFVFFQRELVEGHIQPLVFDKAAVFPLRINLVPLVHLFE